MSERSVMADWIAVDWGTTNLRAFAMSGDTALAAASSERGMAGLARDEFEGALLDLVEPWLAPGRATHVVCCGMVGSRQGWVEAGYEPVPGPPRRAVGLVRAPARDPRLRVYVAHGLKQIEPCDVMRGEETQIAGLIAGEPGFSGTVCLPGTHSKWARLNGGEVLGFTTFMTGELFSLLSRQSVLRHTVAESGWSQSAFIEAVREAMRDPGGITAALFGLRAGPLLDLMDGETARARLSGLLIGVEIAATAGYRQEAPIALIGTAATTGAYRTALAEAGLVSREFDVVEMTVAGLSAAHRHLLAEKVES
jgi:2-dehydro-3-deoxygalactonokinase